MRNLLATLNLSKADLYRMLVEGSFFEDIPTQVDSLEAAAVNESKIKQARDGLFLQGVALGL